MQDWTKLLEIFGSDLECLTPICVIVMKCNIAAAYALVNINVVKKHYSVDREARLNFLNWYLQKEQVGDIFPPSLLFSDEDWFHFSGYMNSHRNMYCCRKSHINPQNALRDAKVRA